MCNPPIHSPLPLHYKNQLYVKVFKKYGCRQSCQNYYFEFFFNVLSLISLPLCSPILSLMGTSGMCLMVNCPHWLSKSSAIDAISPAWRLPFRCGSPEEHMYASPIVSTWNRKSHDVISCQITGQEVRLREAEEGQAGCGMSLFCWGRPKEHMYASSIVSTWNHMTWCVMMRHNMMWPKEGLVPPYYKWRIGPAIPNEGLVPPYQTKDWSRHTKRRIGPAIPKEGLVPPYQTKNWSCHTKRRIGPAIPKEGLVPPYQEKD